jgi:drug/metabolite transporter (DMT)-like permease
LGDAGALAAMGLLAVIAQVLMTFAMGFVRASLSGVLSLVTPVTAMAAGWLWFGERVDRTRALGALVALAGVSWGGWLAARPSDRG